MKMPEYYVSFRDQIIASLLSNLAATVGILWSVFLFLGGLIFLAYFFSIGFMPEIDLQTLVVLLAVSALTGGFLFIILGFSLLTPGWWWVQMTHHHEPLHSPWWFGVPMLFFILGFIGGVFLIPDWWVIPPIVSLIAPLPLLLFCRKLLDKLDNKPRWGTIGVFYRGLLLSAMSFVPLFLLVSSLAGENPELRENGGLVMVTAMISIWGCNMMLVTKRSFSILNLLSFATLAIFLLFYNLGNWTLIPNMMMRTYKFGHFTNASVVLNETGCVIVQRLGLKVTPDLPAPQTDTTSSPKICTLSNVTIHSRLGNTYYLEVFQSADTSLRFTIPGQNVLSWTANESKKATTVGSPASPPNPPPTTDTPTGLQK